MAQAEGSSLAQYVAQETQLFYKHLKEAVEKFEENGELPHSLFGQKAIRELKKQGGRRKPGAADAPKRKPSVFNLYIKEKLEELNAQASSSGVPYKEKFKQVVAEWSKLSDDQKKEYAVKYSGQLAGEEHAEPTPTPAKRPASSSDDESSEEEEKKKKKKKEKKEKHHKHHKNSD